LTLPWIEQGLIDVLCSPHNLTDNFIPEELREKIREGRSRIKNNCKHSVELQTYGTSYEQLHGWLKVCAEEDVQEVIFRESCPMERERTWPLIPRIVKELAIKSED
jgi:hypothetical protein